MKFYLISDSWAVAVPKHGMPTSVFRAGSIDAAILPDRSSTRLGEMLGEEITKEQFISIFNKTIKQYENYFESEGNNQVG